ncbi:MAG: hypothetical protein WAK60_07190 [Sedimentisphaerales bacterium]
MSRKLCLLISFILVTWLSAVQAEPITVENFSFELPGTGKVQIKDPCVPGWTQADPNIEAGIESNGKWGATDGKWTGYLGSGAEIYNLTDYTIQTGDKFQMVFDAVSTWQAKVLSAELYYDDAGKRVVVATKEVDLGNLPQGAWQKDLTLDFNVGDAPASVGHKIGIQFSHSSGYNHWVGLDNVRLNNLKKTDAPKPAK